MIIYARKYQTGSNFADFRSRLNERRKYDHSHTKLSQFTDRLTEEPIITLILHRQVKRHCLESLERLQLFKLHQQNTNNKKLFTFFIGILKLMINSKYHFNSEIHDLMMSANIKCSWKTMLIGKAALFLY
ncbi:hypothetical protein BpHYR1_030297 [Brachionus plicatilis]|uniref:Uncharacterized protein n=1 Tax=Brachionus plicatilis TaxID=10195 RepID=A0A3M7PN33_BRAPC|nr:hypothetical protein BpHYR1_030297 [Brachionus plicatilis]